MKKATKKSQHVAFYADALTLSARIEWETGPKKVQLYRLTRRLLNGELKNVTSERNIYFEQRFENIIICLKKEWFIFYVLRCNSTKPCVTKHRRLLLQRTCRGLYEQSTNASIGSQVVELTERSAVLVIPDSINIIIACPD